MNSTIKVTTVNGKTYTVWSEYFKTRGTYAADPDGKVKRISDETYLKDDLAIRKAIANAHSLPTFRK